MRTNETVARVSEASSESTVSFEDAMGPGIERTAKTLHSLRSAWVKEQQVVIEDSRIAKYRTDMMVTFVVDESD